MFKQRIIIAALLSLWVFSGCAGMKTAFDTHVKGPWYMQQGKYKEGLAVFSRERESDPESPVAAYWMGRYYLALNQPEKGTPLLEQAVRLALWDAEAHFWLGVSYWAQGRWEDERRQYEKVLELKPHHRGANLYLGHHYLDRGQWEKALAQYDRVLELDREQPDALFNRAVALSRLNRVEEAKTAWKKILNRSTQGAKALSAAENLNVLGDFSYRNVLVGKRRVTLGRIDFDAANAVTESGRAYLAVIGRILTRNPNLKLHVVVYLEGDAAAARARSLAVRHAILAAAPGVVSGRLPLSWFGDAEKVEAGGRIWSLEESVHFVTQVQ